MPHIQNDVNPYKQAEREADDFKDWLIYKKQEIFPNNPIFLEFIHQPNFKIFPCVLIRKESEPLNGTFERDTWIFLCKGCDELPTTLKRRWLPRAGKPPPVLKDHHIHRIRQQLDLPEVDLQALQEEALEEPFSEELPPIDTLEEFLNQAQQTTISGLLDLIESNRQEIADWGGLTRILDELGVQALAEMVRAEFSLSDTIDLLQEAYFHRWPKFTAFLNQIGITGFLSLLHAEDYESISPLLFALSQYRWAHLVLFQYTLFNQGLLETRANSLRIFDALRHVRKVSLWAKKWISLEDILSAIEHNPELSLYWLLKFLETNVSKLYRPILGKILQDGAQTFPFRILLRSLDRITPEDMTELKEFDSDWDVANLARQLVACETGWLSFFFSVSTKLTPNTFAKFLNTLDPTTLQKNILQGDKDMPYAWINVIDALHKAKWTKLGQLLDSLGINFLWKPFYDVRVAVLTAKLLNVLLSDDWTQKEAFTIKFASEDWIDLTTGAVLLSFYHLDVLLRHKFHGAIDLSKKIFQSVFVQTPYHWPIKQYTNLFDKMGINWHPWLSPEIILEAESRGHYTRLILEELESQGWSASESLRDYFSDKDAKEKELIFRQYPLAYQAKIRLEQGLLDEALKLFAQALNEFNTNPTVETLRDLIQHSEKLNPEERQCLFSTIDEEALIYACKEDSWLLDLIGEQLVSYCDKKIIRVIMRFLQNHDTFYEYTRFTNYFVDSCRTEFIEEAIRAKAYLVLSHMSKKETSRQAVQVHLAQKNMLAELISDLDPSSPFWESIKHILDAYDELAQAKLFQNIIESAANQGKSHLIRILFSLSPDYAELVIQCLLSLSDETLSAFMSQSKFVEIIALLVDLQEKKHLQLSELFEKFRGLLLSIITMNQDKNEHELLLALIRPEQEN